jgi:hypothetical protein
MTDSDNDQRRSSSLTVWLVAAFVLLPVVYVLSIGPATWLFDHRYINGWALSIYLSLELACDACPPFGRAVVGTREFGCRHYTRYRQPSSSQPLISPPL